MKAWIGTSGFSYKEWKGTFYPEKMPASGMLAYYAERFPTVEINNTFYRMPKAESLAAWLEQVPRHFVFVLKAPQAITHIKRLREAQDATAYFFKTAEALGQHVGPTLFQLPPNMKKDTARLQAFVAHLPSGQRAAFEFRHESWFSEDVYDVLRARTLSLCTAQADDFECPFIATAPYGYLRLRRTDYTSQELKDWAEKIRKAGLDEVFVFLKHEDAGKGPQFAAELQTFLG